MNTNDKQCPICKNTHQKFNPLIGRYHDGVQIKGKKFTIEDWETLNFNEYFCPRCHSSDRARLYYLFLEKEIKRLHSVRQSKISMLHFAPESGALREYLKKNQNLNYRTADLLTKDVDDNVDITKMNSYESNKFDLILCSHVLEHVEDDKAAIREIARVLNPGGTAILMVPVLLRIDKNYEDPHITDAEGRWKAFGQDDHVRVYSKDGFRSLMKTEGGLDVLEYGIDYFGKDNFIKYGIDFKSILYVAHKPSP